MNFEIGKGSPLAFVLAWLFGVLIFLMLLVGLAVAIWWIIAGIRDRIKHREGKARTNYIIGVAVIAGLFFLCLWVTLNPIK